MKTKLAGAFNNLGGMPFALGFLILGSFMCLLKLPSFRGLNTTTFLAYYLIAGIAYALVIHRLGRDHISLKSIWGFAIFFRLILLFTSPSLSDDVYRYVWDGHLLNQGVNPFAQPVDSMLLDVYDTQLRAFVNNAWMASPYLPTSQLIFATVSRLAPQSVFAFQIVSTFFDLLTGWVVMKILENLSLSRKAVLLYLWNPLVIVEFAHAAHIDSLMIFLMMASFWLLMQSQKALQGSHIAFKNNLLSAVALAGATLTKVLPILLVPILMKRWRWKGTVLFFLIIATVLAIFSVNSGWGLSGELDGTGVFGAIRIYLEYWNFNSGIYHWLEVAFSGYQTAGAVPADIVGETPILLAKITTMGLFGAAVLFTTWQVWRKDRNQLNLLRLAIIPLGAYLMLTTTLHPWYLIIIIPLLPFIFAQRGVSTSYQAFIWPWIYLSIAIAFSYLTYYDIDNLREYVQVRALEYVPTYLLLIWAILMSFHQRKNSETAAVRKII